MRTLISSLILISAFAISCQQSEVTPTEDFSISNQRWVLVRMTGSFQNSETTGSDMEWQETYDLTQVGSFVKTRITTESTLQASGSYRIRELTDGLYVEFTYPKESTLIGNCSSDLIELLRFQDDRLFSTWQACDGPGLEYLQSN